MTETKHCRRCGYPIVEGTRHEPYAVTWMDRERKKFRSWACDVFNGWQLVGSYFGRRYREKR
jgi:hypothetical protein